MARQSAKNLRRLIQSSTEVVPLEKSFVEDLKRSIEMTDTKNSRPGSNNYKPSSMKCIRQCYYTRMSKPQKRDASYCLVGICNSGSMTHEFLQYHISKMKDNGMDVEYVNVGDFIRSRGIENLEIQKDSDIENGVFETKLLDTKRHISFLCDGLLRIDGKYVILEIKTESQYKFISRSDVNPEHHNQATIYSAELGIKNVLFLYTSRDNSDLKAYIYTPSDEQKDKLFNMIDTCEGYVNRQIAPPKPEDVSKSTCMYCNYKDLCKANMN